MSQEMVRTRTRAGGGDDNLAGARKPDEMDRTQALDKQMAAFAGQVTTFEGLVRQLVQQQAATAAVHVLPPRHSMGTSTGTSAQVSQGTTPVGVAPAAQSEDTAAAAHRTPPSTTTGVAHGTIGAAPMSTTGLSTVPFLATTSMGGENPMALERNKAKANLVEFKRYDPPKFRGETTDPAVVEEWVSTMKKLFEDMFMEEHEKVPLATHCLEGPTRIWWRVPDRTAR